VSDRPDRPAGVSRRRFVAVVAAGSAAFLARPAAAVAAVAKTAQPRAKAPDMTVVQRKEYDRQRTGTLDMLKVIRAHAMPPGTEMASVFRARRPAKKAR
jgi:hypothetical protein